MNASNDPEALALGRLYRFIHERAEYLRQQKAAGDSICEADPPAAVSTSGKTGRKQGVYHDEQK